MSALAPVVLFVYNRPVHTLKTLEALAQNIFSDESDLFIYADGPVNNASTDEMNLVAEVRKIIRQKQWCKNVTISESDINIGLAASIRNGVTETINKCGKIIVLEDDLITSRAFLAFMNNALSFYEKYPSVFSITGYNIPADLMGIPASYPYDVFVCLRNGSWGWATWADRWNQTDWEISHFKALLDQPFIKQAFNRGGDDVYELLEKQASGKLNIWSIQFTLAHFVHHAVAIAPTHSFVENIGLDSSGQNCAPDPKFHHTRLNEKTDIRFLDILYEDSRLINGYYNVFCRRKRPLWQKIINRIARYLGRRNIFILKKKIYC